MPIAGLDVTELVELALMLVAVGALSGFFAGIFGIGGGAILVVIGGFDSWRGRRLGPSGIALK